MPRIYIPTTGPESWQGLLADPTKHWRRGYSARTLAHAWEAASGVPPEVAGLLGVEVELLLALPEHKVPLPGGERASQTDLFALVRADGKTVSVAVEGKVNEPFGQTINDWFDAPSAGKRERLSFLCSKLGLAFPPAGHLHYQLFHRAASAVLEAERFKTDEAAMIVHSFSTDRTWFDAFAQFSAAFGVSVEAGKRATIQLPCGRSFHLGWANGDRRFLEM